MRTSVTRFRIRTLGIGEQAARFRSTFPTFTTSRPRPNRLVCRGELQPSALSDTYFVRITYEITRTPQVDIEEPILQRRDPQKRIPHTYEGDRPCTFRPGVDWRSDRSLVLVVPWVSMWLFFYEVWYVSGEWLGGGVGHDKPEIGTMDAIGRTVSPQQRRNWTRTNTKDSGT